MREEPIPIDKTYLVLLPDVISSRQTSVQSKNMQYHHLSESVQRYTCGLLSCRGVASIEPANMVWVV